MKAFFIISAIAVVAALSFGPASASAHVGPYGPAGVTCYNDGLITIEPNFDKIGVGAQSLGYRIYIYDNLRRSGFWWGDWRVFASPNNTMMVPIGKVWGRFAQSDYYVGISYAWNIGHGWEQVFVWTNTYTIGGDFFGSDSRICTARPQIVSVP